MNRFFRFVISVLLMTSSGLCTHVLASEPAAPAKPVDPKLVSEDIFKKCMSHAKMMRDEQVCKARKASIEQCVDKESKAKDAKAAKAKCETLYLPDFK